MKTTAARWILALMVLAGFLIFPANAGAGEKIRLAVEFVDHAACAHIAVDQNWYEKSGLKVEVHDAYVTGMALSAALSRRDVDAAYVCLFPAINARANAGAPIKIVSGTHLYGYGLVVNRDRVGHVRDLEKPGIRIGCTREGSPGAALLNKLVEKYELDSSLVGSARRMSPPKLLLSLQTGRIDAAVMPEQFPSMARAAGFHELVSAKDLWPGMQGSVLVVTDDFLQKRPEAVKTLVELTRKGIDYINTNPTKAAGIVTRRLNAAGKRIFPGHIAGNTEKLAVFSEVIQISLEKKMENTWQIDPAAVQAAIDEAARLGYIRESFPAKEMLDLRFLNE